MSICDMVNMNEPLNQGEHSRHFDMIYVIWLSWSIESRLTQYALWYDIYNKERVAKKLRNRPDNLLLRLFSMVSPIGIDFEKQDFVTDALVEIRYDVNANLTQIDGVELTGPEQSEVQKILATDKKFRSELKLDVKTFTIL